MTREQKYLEQMNSDKKMHAHISLKELKASSNWLTEEVESLKRIKYFIEEINEFELPTKIRLNEKNCYGFLEVTPSAIDQKVLIEVFYYALEHILSKMEIATASPISSEELQAKKLKTWKAMPEEAKLKLVIELINIEISRREEKLMFLLEEVD